MDVRTVTEPLPSADERAVRALVARAAAADGVAPLDESALLALAAAPAAGAERPAFVHVVALSPRPLAPAPPATSEQGDPRSPLLSDVAAGPAGASEGVVGYAQVDLGGAVPGGQLVVDPAARRRGVGRALLEAAVAAAGTGRAGATLEVWAHGDLPAARALAAAAGFVPVHELWRMALDLASRGSRTALPAPPLPPGLAVRPFRPGYDEPAWLAVNARAFARHPDQGRWTKADLLAREREPWFDPAGLLLAERNDDAAGPELAGFVWTKVHPAGDLAPDEVGEIYVLGVDPSAQGAGLGRALTAAGLDHLAARGLRTAVLWVAGDEEVPIHTYRRAGFERVALDVRYARRP